MSAPTPSWPYNIDDPVTAVHHALDPHCPWDRPEHCTEYPRIQRALKAYDTWRSHRPAPEPETWTVAVHGEPAPLTVVRVDPVEEVAVAPDSVDDLHKHLGIHPSQTGLPFLVGEYMGLPVVVDESLPSRTVRMRARTSKETTA